MADKNQPDDETPDTLTRQLEHSRHLRQEAERTMERAEETTGEMAGVLRRIAEAMDRNPRSWDELFRSNRRERA